MKNYSLPEIFEKDKTKLNNLKEEYNNFIERIDEATSGGKISVYHRRVILDMIAKRLRKMGLNDDDIQRATLLPIEEIKLLYK